MLMRSRLSSPVQDAVEDLEQDIIFGVLRPNEELVEDALMLRLNAKRHVIRAAIQELVARRIVRKPHGKSARVIDLSLKEVEQIYHMRELLQREAARIMPFPVKKSDLNALKEIHVQHVAAASVSANKKLIHELNDKFHRALFAMCGNKELSKAINYYTEVSNPIRSYGIAVTSWLPQAIEEHAAMIHALEQQDSQLLQQLVVNHMHPTRKHWEALYTGNHI